MIETGLKDKVIVVTGGANGIGRATALRFAQEGCRVSVWDVRDDGFASLNDEVTAFGGQVEFVKTDVSSGESVQAALNEVLARWNRVDVLVNNAGILRDAQLVKVKDGEVQQTMSDQLFDSVIAVNLRGPFVCTRAVAAVMIKQGDGGVILNASSVVGLYGNFGQTNYVASKAGLIGMTKTWARELGRYKIRVNAVAPGFIATEMVRQMPEKILQTMAEHTPLRRLGEPADIANAYVWLASDAASFVSGAVLSVDGGVVTGT